MQDVILIVEDNISIQNVICEFLNYLLEDSSTKILKAKNTNEAEDHIESEDLTLLITDVNLGFGDDGLDLVRSINKRKEKPYIIITSSIEWLDKVRSFLDSGQANAFLNKPFTLADLKGILKDSGVTHLK